MIWDAAWGIAWFVLAGGTLIAAIPAFFRAWTAGALAVSSGLLFLVMGIWNAAQQPAVNVPVTLLVVEVALKATITGMAFLLLALGALTGRIPEAAPR